MESENEKMEIILADLRDGLNKIKPVYKNGKVKNVIEELLQIKALKDAKRPKTGPKPSRPKLVAIRKNARNVFASSSDSSVPPSQDPFALSQSQDPFGFQSQPTGVDLFVRLFTCVQYLGQSHANPSKWNQWQLSRKTTKKMKKYFLLETKIKSRKSLRN